MVVRALLFFGFWNKHLGILGALGSIATFVSTVTIIPFMPNGWAASAGGFPAMAGNVPHPDEGCHLARSLHLSSGARRGAGSARLRKQVKPLATAGRASLVPVICPLQQVASLALVLNGPRPLPPVERLPALR